MASDRIEIDPIEHPQVAAALARLGGCGAWTRIRAGQQVDDPLDLADVELLVEVGILDVVDGGLVLTRSDALLTDGQQMSDALHARLRRAVQHAGGGSGAWSAADEELLLRQGRSSVAAAHFIANELVPSMPGVAESFQAGRARFLDVGVGVAAICIALCRRFDGTTAVGIDVLPEVIRIAAAELANTGLESRIEIRLQSMTELADLDAFDLAWVAQPFIPRASVDAGLERVLLALRPGGWLVMPVTAVPEGGSPLEHAFMRHAAAMLGGGSVDPEQIKNELTGLGFDQVTAHRFIGQVVMAARRPT